jgi:hypothetical protein
LRPAAFLIGLKKWLGFASGGFFDRRESQTECNKEVRVVQATYGEKTRIKEKAWTYALQLFRLRRKSNGK